MNNDAEVGTWVAQNGSDSQDRSLSSLPENVMAVTATSFLTDISSEMVLNVLPLFLANVLGVRTALIGLIEGLAETTASLVKIFSGWLSDRLGTRKWLAVVGYGISTVAKPFLYFATSWSAVLAVRFSDRFGKGVRTAPRDALVADSIDKDRRGLAFGVHRAGDTAGALVGLLIALLVVWLTQQRGATLTLNTFRWLVGVSIIPAVLAVIVLALMANDVPLKVGREAPRLSLAGFEPRFRRFLAVMVVFTLGNSADAFLILRAQERGLSVLSVLGMLATFNAVYALVSGPAGALSDRIGRRRLIIGGWLLYGVLYAGFALAGAGWQIWVLYALYGIYHGTVEGTARAYVADLVGAEQRGTAYGVFSAAVGLAVLPASVIAGVLWQGVGSWTGFGPRAPFIFGAVLALAAVALFVWWLPRPARVKVSPTASAATRRPPRRRKPAIENLTIRKAEKDDLEALHRLYDEIHQQHVDALPWMFQMPDPHVKHNEQILDQIKNREGVLLVAETEGQVIGLAEATIKRVPDRADMNPHAYAHVDTLVIGSEWRGRGVGRRLMEQVHRWARVVGLNTVVLGVWHFNQEAIFFYEDLGYEAVEQRMRINLDDLL